MPNPTEDTSSQIPFVGGSYPVRAGNYVRPLIDGVPAFGRICEAVDAATASVWVTVTFLWPEFRMPDGRAFFDVLDAAVARTLDVRVLFWRPDWLVGQYERNTFWGSPAHRELLAGRKSEVRIRWDRAHSGFAQHQKSWLIDAGEESEVAFVGGINQNPHSVVAPGHSGEGENHDVYLELAGPCASDVHHNFVQRWNEASDRDALDGSWGDADDLAFPYRASRPRGTATAQVQRTIHEGRYSDGHAAPGSGLFPIASGEKSILAQYVAAIENARRTIYIENQYVEVLEIVSALDGALARGVAVTVVVPGVPDYSSPRFHSDFPGRRAFLDARAALGRYPLFTLAGIASRGEDGRRNDIYVHAKLMLIDDCWATIGSCNLHFHSLHGNGEMNVSFADASTVRALRCDLLSEHLSEDTRALDDITAMTRFRTIAAANRAKRDAGDPGWHGLAFAIDPARYGRE